MAAQTPVIEAGRVFIPHDAAWLDGYLHELAMFPKGRFVMRHYDGFYHVTAQEWQEIELLQGITRMEGMS